MHRVVSGFVDYARFTLVYLRRQTGLSELNMLPLSALVKLHGAAQQISVEMVQLWRDIEVRSDGLHISTWLITSQSLSCPLICSL